MVQCGEHQRAAREDGPGALPDGGRGQLPHPTPGAHPGGSGRWVSVTAAATLSDTEQHTMPVVMSRPASVGQAVLFLESWCYPCSCCWSYCGVFG